VIVVDCYRAFRDGPAPLCGDEDRAQGQDAQHLQSSACVDHAVPPLLELASVGWCLSTSSGRRQLGVDWGTNARIDDEPGRQCDHRDGTGDRRTRMSSNPDE
jgi:hypothetical protein